jgi:hypothetical protein
MPTQLPLEATVYFGSKLLPLMPQILEVDAKKDFQMQTHIARDIRDVSQSEKYFPLSRKKGFDRIKTLLF